MIVAGLGFRADATERSLADALAQAEDRAGARATALATGAPKNLAAAFRALVSRTGLPAYGVQGDDLRRQVTATSSAASLTTYGTGSVAEAAALAAAGPGARLLAPRTVSPDRWATCALAEAPEVAPVRRNGGG